MKKPRNLRSIYWHLNELRERLAKEVLDGSLDFETSWSWHGTTYIILVEIGPKNACQLTQISVDVGCLEDDTKSFPNLNKWLGAALIKPVNELNERERSERFRKFYRMHYES